MPDNITNLELTPNTWTDLYVAAGAAPGVVLSVENIGDADVYLATQATKPDNDHDAYNVLKRPPSVVVQNQPGDAGAWAYCQADGGKLEISTAALEGFLPVVQSRLYDGFGNPISSLNGAIDVHHADVHQGPINDYVHRHTGLQTTLAAPASIGDTQVTVVSTAGFTASALGTPGDLIHFGPTLQFIEPVHPELTDLPGGNVMVLDRPLDNDFAVGTPVIQSIPNMASAAGTLATPVVYRYFPSPGRVEHILRLILDMVHTSTGDDSLFGNIARLENGIVLRARINNVVRTFTNWKTNGDIKLDVFEVVYTSKAGGGKHSTAARGAFSDLDVAIRLDQAQGDYFEVLVQDGTLLSEASFESLRIKVQGHVEGAQ